MNISLSTLILFVFCAFNCTQCVFGVEQHDLGENMRREFGKKPLTKKEKETELLDLVSVEELFLKSKIEQQKSSTIKSMKSMFKMKGAAPNCYIQKWTTKKRSIKHDLFSKKEIRIPKIKGKWEEHEVQFSHFVQNPQNVPMMKCSCEFLHDRLGKDTDSNSSSSNHSENQYDNYGREDNTIHAESTVVIDEIERTNETHTFVQNEIPPIQAYQPRGRSYHSGPINVDRGQYFMTNTKINEQYEESLDKRTHHTSITEHEQKTSPVVTTHTEIHKDNSNSLVKGEKDHESIPSSPKEPNGELVMSLSERLKKYIPWGRGKTATEKTPKDEHENNSSVSNEQEAHFTANTKVNAQHEESIDRRTYHMSNTGITEQEQKTSLVEERKESTDTEKSSTAITAHTEMHKENSDSLVKEEKEHESTPSSLEEPSGGLVTTLRNSLKKYILWGESKTAEKTHEDEQENNSRVSIEHKVTVKTEGETHQNAFQDIESHQFQTKNDQEKVEISEHKSIIAAESEENLKYISSEERTSHKHLTAISSASSDFSQESEAVKRQMSKKAVIIDKNSSSSAKVKNRSSAAEEEIEKLGVKNLSISTESVQMKKTHEIKHASNEMQNKSGQSTSESVVIDKEKNEQNTENNLPSAGQGGIVQSVIGSLGGLLGRFSGQTQIESAKSKDSSSSEEENESTGGKLIIIPARRTVYEETMHTESTLEGRADVSQRRDISLSDDSNPRKESKSAEETVVEVQKAENSLSYEGKEGSYHEKVMKPHEGFLDFYAEGDRLLSQPLTGGFEEQVEGNHSRSSNQQDEKSVLSKDFTVGVEWVHQEEISDEKKSSVKSHEELIARTVNESDTSYVEEKATEKLRVEEHKKLETIEREKTLSFATNSSPSSSSSESDSKGDSTEKLTKKDEIVLEKHSGDEYNNAKTMTSQKEIAESLVLERMNEDNSSGNNKHRELTFEGSRQRGDRSEDYKFEVEKTVTEQTIKATNSESFSDEVHLKEIKKVQVEEDVVQSSKHTEKIHQIEDTQIELKDGYHHSKKEEKSGSSESSDESTRSRKEFHSEMDEGITKDKSLEDNVKHKEKHFNEMGEEEDQSTSNTKIVLKDKSSTSSEIEETSEKLVIVRGHELDPKEGHGHGESNESTKKHIFRRSPEYLEFQSSRRNNMTEENVKNAYNIPPGSICVKEDNKRFVYLSKGYLKDKSFFVYRKTGTNEFYPIAYIILS